MRKKVLKAVHSRGKGLGFSLVFGELLFSPCCAHGFCLERPRVVEFPQPSADFLPSGWRNITKETSEVSQSPKSPFSSNYSSCGLCHPFERHTWRGLECCSHVWGVHVSMGWGSWGAPQWGKRAVGFLPLGLAGESPAKGCKDAEGLGPALWWGWTERIWAL